MSITYSIEEDINIGSDKMAYDICKKCQRFFEKSGKQYCLKCDSELTLSRESINEYLLSNPNASVMEIVKETGVKLKDVNIFLETGGAATRHIHSEKNTVNLRKEEMQKKQVLIDEKENARLKNNFRSRRLRGD